MDDLDGVYAMTKFLNSRRARYFVVPIMIDSSKWKSLKGLKVVQGKVW
jgi:cobalamin-dependent methionine synthase I